MNEASTEQASSRAAQKRWSIPWWQLVKWWNIPTAAIFVIAVLSIILPFRNPWYTKDFAGNVVSEIWGALLSAGVAWVLLKRFWAERLTPARPFGFDDAFSDLYSISKELTEAALLGPADLRRALDAATRARLRSLSMIVYRKTVVFGRFLEVERLFDLEKCWCAAEMLAEDASTSDAQYMVTALQNIFHLHDSAGGGWEGRDLGVGHLDVSRKLLDSKREWTLRMRAERQAKASSA